MTGSGQADEPEQISVPLHNRALGALAIVQSILLTDGGPERFDSDPRGAFEAAKEGLAPEAQELTYEDIPEDSRRALEGLSLAELELLAKLDKTFFEDRMYVKVPPVGKACIK
jgi:hypothetical protein